MFGEGGLFTGNFWKERRVWQGPLCGDRHQHCTPVKRFPLATAVGLEDQTVRKSFVFTGRNYMVSRFSTHSYGKDITQRFVQRSTITVCEPKLSHSGNNYGSIEIVSTISQ